MKVSNRSKSLLLSGFILSTLFSSAAYAEITSRDIQVAARAIAFLSTKPKGVRATAIIYDQANAASKAEADSLSKLLSASAGTGKVKFSAPKLVDISSLADMSGVEIAFLTSGLTGQHSSIAEAASTANVLTVSVELDCARQGLCVLGIQSQPKVEMLISKKAASQAGKQFLPTLLMLAKEV